MSADGNWKITISTPMGPQEVTAHITTQGDTFTGRTESPMGSQEITDSGSGAGTGTGSGGRTTTSPGRGSGALK